MHRLSGFGVKFFVQKHADKPRTRQEIPRCEKSRIKTKVNLSHLDKNVWNGQSTALANSRLFMPRKIGADWND